MATMSQGQPSKRTQRARSEMGYRRRTMESVKDNIRNELMKRLRSKRSKSVDRLRKIDEHPSEAADCQSFYEIKKALTDTSGVISSDDMVDLIREVEEDMKRVSLEAEGERYVAEINQEIEECIQRLLLPCSVCQYMSTENICLTCKSQLFTDSQ